MQNWGQLKLARDLVAVVGDEWGFKRRLLWNISPIYPKWGHAWRRLSLMLVLAEVWVELQPAWREGGSRLEDGGGGRLHKQMFEARPLRWWWNARRGEGLSVSRWRSRLVGTEARRSSDSRRNRVNWPDSCHLCENRVKIHTSQCPPLQNTSDEWYCLQGAPPRQCSYICFKLVLTVFLQNCNCSFSSESFHFFSRNTTMATEQRTMTRDLSHITATTIIKDRSKFCYFIVLVIVLICSIVAFLNWQIRFWLPKPQL